MIHRRGYIILVLSVSVLCACSKKVDDDCSYKTGDGICVDNAVTPQDKDLNLSSQ